MPPPEQVVDLSIPIGFSLDDLISIAPSLALLAKSNLASLEGLLENLIKYNGDYPSEEMTIVLTVIDLAKRYKEIKDEQDGVRRDELRAQIMPDIQKLIEEQLTHYIHGETNEDNHFKKLIILSGLKFIAADFIVIRDFLANQETRKIFEDIEIQVRDLPIGDDKKLLYRVVSLGILGVYYGQEQFRDLGKVRQYIFLAQECLERLSDNESTFKGLGLVMISAALPMFQNVFQEEIADEERIEVLKQAILTELNRLSDLEIEDPITRQVVLSCNEITPILNRMFDSMRNPGNFLETWQLQRELHDTAIRHIQTLVDLTQTVEDPIPIIIILALLINGTSIKEVNLEPLRDKILRLKEQGVRLTSFVKSTNPFSGSDRVVKGGMIKSIDDILLILAKLYRSQEDLDQSRQILQRIDKPTDDVRAEQRDVRRSMEFKEKARINNLWYNRLKRRVIYDIAPKALFITSTALVSISTMYQWKGNQKFEHCMEPYKSLASPDSGLYGLSNLAKGFIGCGAHTCLSALGRVFGNLLG